MKILSNKLVIGLIGLIVLAMFTIIGFYFGIRWASQDVLGFDSQPDRLTVDLEQKRVQLEKWGNDFLEAFPNVPAVKATLQSYQEILSQVIDRNEQLRQKGMSARGRIKQLTQFAKEISGPIAERTRSTELHLELMHENSELKEKIDRYVHADWMLPLPIYLLGLNENEMSVLQEQLPASQHGHR
ncbi:hypothetical protein J4G02_11800 [Candidatus Poribacteria bacterium]|nr:hypothetical protein [Candidatus Poribacteria bacterium]